jgi:hypothetical protein
MKNQQTNKKNKTKVLLKCENLKRKQLLFTVWDSAQQPKPGPRPAFNTRMGSEPSNQRLGRPSGPAPQPAWAQSGPSDQPTILCR